MSDKNKTTIQFNKVPEEILRSRKVEQAQSAEQAAAQARMAALKQPRSPRGGAAVRIPPLDAQHIEGRTMDEQASALTDPTNPLAPSYNPQLAEMQNRMNAGHPLAPLPPEVQTQPGFRPGVGSMYAANQPMVSVQPQGPYKPQLRTETMESIKALETFRSKAETQQQVQLETKKEEAEKLEKEVSATKTPFDEFDYEAFRSFRDKDEWNMLNNPKRRKEIESQLLPMKVEDVILLGEVRQDVPIAPNIIITFRSVGGDEDLAVKQMMFGERGGDRYVYDKYSLMQITLGVFAINNMPLPNHLDTDNKVDEKKFMDKFNKVARFPVQFLANLGVNYSWFDERVRMLFLFGGSEQLKNG
jgi:hypothetical protein